PREGGGPGGQQQPAAVRARPRRPRPPGLHLQRDRLLGPGADVRAGVPVLSRPPRPAPPAPPPRGPPLPPLPPPPPPPRPPPPAPTAWPPAPMYQGETPTTRARA